MSIKKYSNNWVFSLFLVLFLILGIFLSGCTKQPEDTKIKTSNGLIINRVFYEKEIPENSQIEITVEIKNNGFEARDVNITLIGLTDKWIPAPPISRNLNKIETNEIKNVSFIIRSPVIIENRTDNFGIKMEYNYASKYEIKIKLEKDEKGNVTLNIDSLRLLREAPITIKLSRQQIIGNREVHLNFTISNSGSGKAREIRVTSEFLVCDKNLLELNKESTFSCKFSIPQFDEIKILEFYLTLSYIYEYQTNLAYKIKVFNKD